MRRVYRRMTDNSPSRSRGVSIATAWALLAIIATGMLMEKHLTAIEPAGTYHEVEAQVKANEDWTVTHIFSAECPCSARTIEGVLHQEDIPGVYERYIVSHPSNEWAKRFSAAGKELQIMTPDALQRSYGIRGGPFLVIQDHTSTVRYRGGYGARLYLRPDELRNREVLAQLKAGKELTIFPAIGCQL